MNVDASAAIFRRVTPDVFLNVPALLKCDGVSLLVVFAKFVFSNSGRI